MIEMLQSAQTKWCYSPIKVKAALTILSSPSQPLWKQPNYAPQNIPANLVDPRLAASGCNPPSPISAANSME